jgi:hypothetical protein
MIEMTNDIHMLKMHRESMKKELMFRKQREEQMDSNLKKIQMQLDKALYTNEELSRNLDEEMDEQTITREENKQLKNQIESFKLENQEM